MPVHQRYQTFIEDQRRFFDELISEDWDTYSSKSWDETRRHEISHLFSRFQPATVLDIGCGCGFHDSEMANQPFVQSVHAIDYSARSIEKANEAYPHPKVTRWVADFATDRPQQRYDLVVSFQVFEHLSNTERYFQFCREACAPDGRIAIFTPNGLRLRNRLRSLRGQPLELLDPMHFKEYTAGEIVAMAESAGFGHCSSHGYGLEGLGFVDRRPNRFRLRAGSALYPVASGLCVIMKLRCGDVRI